MSWKNGTREEWRNIAWVFAPFTALGIAHAVLWLWGVL